MQLTFESLAELKDFMSWIGDLAHPRIEGPKATIVVQDLPIEATAEELEIAEANVARVEAEPVDKPARKRRTKAEMEAARAAETANPTSVESAAIAQTPSGADSSEPTADALVAATSASAPADGTSDAGEFIKSRLAERPEVSQVEHLNLARTFIGKHGMEKYNASFPLAGLTPNVMGYSPADCATHAAALDFLSLE